LIFTKGLAALAEFLAFPKASELHPVSPVSRIAALPAWERIEQHIAGRSVWLEQIQIELTRIPAPTFHELDRAAYVADRFRELGFAQTRVDEAGNVLAERPGTSNRCLAITAHLDTVVPKGVPIEIQRHNGRIYGPGITDNGAGLTALLGAASVLQESALLTDLSLLFVANVGEEGEGNLYGMRHLLSRAELRQHLAGVLVLDGAATSRIAVAGLGSQCFLVEVSGPGGHSWKDFGRANPIHALARAVASLSQLVLPEDPRTTLNVGVIQGGTSINSIPASAWMKVDIRSAQREEIERLTSVLESTVRASVEHENLRSSGTLQLRMVPLGERPAAEPLAHSPLLDAVREADQYLGMQSHLERSSTDANIPLSLGIDAIAIGGGGSGGGAHTPNEWYDPQGRELGLKRILLAILTLASVRS
jgi:acetylornithine deacetylase/succinyl-diaminopimelate desuccinylase-like protein